MAIIWLFDIDLSIVIYLNYILFIAAVSFADNILKF